MSDQTQAIQKASPLIGLASRFSIEPTKLLEVLKATVFKPHKDGKPASDEEVAALCVVANAYNLNPFLKELYAFPDGKGGIVPMVPIDGWTRIINAHEQFNGCEFVELHDEKGKLISTTCRMFKKGMETPVVVTEYLSECFRNTGPWNQMPHRMLRHKSYMQAGRYAFSLSGIYDEDEARDIINVTPVAAPVPMPKPKQIAAAPKSDEPKNEPAADPKPAETAKPSKDDEITITDENKEEFVSKAFAEASESDIEAACKGVFELPKNKKKFTVLYIAKSPVEQIVQFLSNLEALAEERKADPQLRIMELYEKLTEDEKKSVKSATGAESIEVTAVIAAGDLPETLEYIEKLIAKREKK